MSRLNPFRNPDYVSSNLTGTSSSHVAPVPSTSTSENTITDEQHDPHPSSSSNHLPTTTLSEDDPLVEDLPPAYTPAPDVYEGETTLELGPRRPFQQTPTYLPPPGRPLQSPYLSDAQRAASTRIRPSATGSHLIPPRHPYLSRSASSSRIDQRSIIPDSPSAPVSDFARDFYTAGADTSLLNGASTQDENGSGSLSTRAPPHQYTQSASNLSSLPDDGRPTERPTPGHPLLRNGKVLVYPTGYECRKCQCRFCLCPDRAFSRSVPSRPQHRLQKLRSLAPVLTLLGQVRSPVFKCTRALPVGLVCCGVHHVPASALALHAAAARRALSATRVVRRALSHI